jgi:anti-sigma factor RsiW
MKQSPYTEADLQAYVDDALPQLRRAEIDLYLAAEPDEADRLDAYRRQKDELRDLFNPVMDEPIPAAMLHIPPQRRWGLQRFVAGLAIAVISGVAGWTLHGKLEPVRARSPFYQSSNDAAASPFAHQAAIAHIIYSPEVRHPVEVDADQEGHLVTWLSKRLGTPIHPPKLRKVGYELIGGRLLPGQSGPVAQFMYHNADGQRLTLYVSTEQSSNKDTGFRFAEEGPVNVFYWIDGKFGYALSAPTGKAELARIAEVVYEQLEKS